MFTLVLNCFLVAGQLLDWQTFPDFYPLPDADYVQVTNIEIDSLSRHQVYLGFNRDSLPLYYFSRIHTVVCQSQDCKPIKVTVFWSLDGDYLKYEVTNDHPFTKMDHAEFEDKDYLKMHRILSNSKSVLGDYKLMELVSMRTGQVHQDVDGISGATIKTVRNDVIEGAAYTCHTLWHLIHARKRQFLQFTEQMLDRQLGCQLLNVGNLVQQRIALSLLEKQENLTDCEVEGLWSILASSNVFLAQQAFRLIPLASLGEKDAQARFWTVFSELPFVIQSTAINRFKEEASLNASILQKVALLYETANYRQCEDILKILEGVESWSDEICYGLINGVRNRDKPYYELLIRYLKKQTAAPEQWLTKINEVYEE